MVHWVEPVRLKVPFSQGTGETAGFRHLNPSGHWLHVSCPSESAYVPLRQGTWVDSWAEGQCDPAGHWEQTRLPLGAYVFASHGIGSEPFLGHLGHEWKSILKMNAYFNAQTLCGIHLFTTLVKKNQCGPWVCIPEHSTKETKISNLMEAHCFLCISYWNTNETNT